MKIILLYMKVDCACPDLLIVLKNLGVFLIPNRKKKEIPTAFAISHFDSSVKS